MKHLYLSLFALLLSISSFAVLGPISGASHVCVGSTTTLSNTTTGGTWSSSTPSTATVGFSSGVVTGVAGGTVTITYTVGASFVIQAMTVDPLPALFSVTGGGGYCPGGSVHIGLSGSETGVTYTLYRTGVAVAGPVSGTGASLDFGVFTIAGTYIVIATTTAGCTRNMTGSTTVSIYPLPTAYTLYTPGSGVICGGSFATLTLSGSQTGVIYQLYRSGVPVGSAVPGTGVAISFPSTTVAGSYSAVGIDAATGCTNNMLGPVTISTTPSPGPITGGSGACVGSTTTLADTTTGGTWSSSNPAVASISSTGVVTALTVGSTTISYAMPSGCTSTLPFNVINLVLPITGTSHTCVGHFTALADASPSGTWTSANPAVATVGSTSGLVSGITTGTAVVSYTVGGSCGYVSTTVTVTSTPGAITGISSVCAGGTSSLSSSPSGGAWSSSNTAVATVGSTGIVTTIASGSATISYTVSGCASTTVMSVDPPPVITGIGTMCVGNTTPFTSSIAGSWTSSNPFVASISSLGLVTGVSPGTATITCTSFSTGCVSTHNITITSGCSGTPAAGVAHIASNNICAGNADLLYLTGASSACGVSFQWEYSTDSIWWLPLSGATDDSFIDHPQQALYYRGKATCFTSGLSGYSTPVHVQVFNHIASHSIIDTPSTFCNGPGLLLNTCGIQPASNVKTWYGDGTVDSLNLYAYPGSGAYSYQQHGYNISGTYTIKQVLRNGLIPQDSVSYSYNYHYCRTLPVSFFFDANSNCIDDDNAFVYGAVTTEVDSNGVPVDTITAGAGFVYSALGGPGTVYRFKVIGHDTGVVLSCPSSGIIYDTITSYANGYPVKFIGFNCASSGNFDVYVSGTTSCWRHTAYGEINAGNTYCTVENPVVTMTFSPHYSFGSSYPAPYSVVGNTVTWHLSNVTSHSYYWGHNIEYTLNVPGPFLTAGDTIHTDFTVTPLSGDMVPANNYYSIVDTVRASFDPNNIQVRPGGLVIPCTPLQYTIHFQNTGNDTAHNIAVVDTLPDYVNVNSLKLVSSTSMVYLAFSTYSGHHVVKFDFPGINLPDSSHHDRSIGSVIFTVKTKSGLSDGTTIMNHASIYFDDNLPVMTDTVYNAIGMSPVTGPGNVCNGSSVTLADASLNGVWGRTNTNATVSGGLVTGVTPGVDTISYTLSNSCTSRSATKSVTVNAVVAPAVTINSGTGMGDSVCVGTSPLFAAMPVNGGSAPIYQWSVNGTVAGTDSTYSYIPLDGDVLSLALISNAECVSPDTAFAGMTLTVLNPPAPVDSMIAIPGIMISPGTVDTFVAVIISSGPTPSFEWLVNGIPTGDTTDTFITHTLVDKDSVTCITTSPELCHLSSFNSFIITVSSVGVKNIPRIGEMALFPNPNKGDFTLRGVMLTSVNEEVGLEITNMMGQVIYTGKAAARNGVINEHVQLDKNVPNGMYLLTLRSGADSKVYHFVLEQ